MTNFQTAREAMVDCQVRPSDVTKYPIIDALLKTPKEKYVPLEKQSVAYIGEHITLPDNRVILDPRIFAKMLDAVSIRAEELVLDVGCGTGYSTAVIAKLAQAVVALESNIEMAEFAQKALEGEGVDNAIVISGNLYDGDEKHGLYDVIIIQGGVQKISKNLKDQLKDGGRIISIFTDGAMGQCFLGIKRGSDITWRSEFDATAPIIKDFSESKSFTFV
jgi:protein-L-isoaspartate(D-aspartate) O-methyltransferase